MKLGTMLVVVAVLVALVPGVTSAGGAFDRETLSGLKGVAVVVEPPVKTLELQRLPAETLQADVEKRLRKSRIPILTVEKAEDPPGKPCLYVTVNAKTTSGDTMVYSIDVALKQEVRLTRNGILLHGATTWSTRTLGISDDTNRIRNALVSIVGSFCDDYEATNPK